MKSRGEGRHPTCARGKDGAQAVEGLGARRVVHLRMKLLRIYVVVREKEGNEDEEDLAVDDDADEPASEGGWRGCW